MAEEANWLGKGFRFPVAINSYGGFGVSESGENVKESLVILLSTKPGERVLHADYGCDLASAIFLPVNDVMLSRIRQVVTEAITLYEPRVIIASDNIQENLGVRAEFDSVNDAQVNIFVRYKLIAVNVIENLVYPFYIIAST